MGRRRTRSVAIAIEYSQFHTSEKRGYASGTGGGQASSPATALTIEIVARKAFIYGLLILAALIVANLTGLLVRYVWGLRNIYGLVPLVDFDGEGNLPTLFAVFLLACCTALLATIGAFERRRDLKASRYWFGLSVVAAYITIDEGAQIHEKIGAAVRIYFQMSTVEETLEDAGLLCAMRALLLHAAALGVKVETAFASALGKR